MWGGAQARGTVRRRRRAAAGAGAGYASYIHGQHALQQQLRTQTHSGIAGNTSCDVLKLQRVRRGIILRPLEAAITRYHVPSTNCWPLAPFIIVTNAHALLS
jgi:hypothetical protein